MRAHPLLLAAVALATGTILIAPSPDAAPAAPAAVADDAPLPLAAADQWVAELERGNTVRFVLADSPATDHTAASPVAGLPDDIVPLPTLTDRERAELIGRCRRLAHDCRAQLDEFLTSFDDRDPEQQRRWGELVHDVELFTACERAVAAGTFFVEGKSTWHQVAGMTIFRMPQPRQDGMAWTQIVLRHRDHSGVENAKAFAAHQDRLANDMVATRFNGLSHEQRLALVDRRDEIARNGSGSAAEQHFMATEFPLGVRIDDQTLLMTAR
ncbi:MAG: hypothetical protein IPK26_27755 [Planctomycetes bacterium]|nr:hypothetical protein [Planctomycetota bacterium]